MPLKWLLIISSFNFAESRIYWGRIKQIAWKERKIVVFFEDLAEKLWAKIELSWWIAYQKR